MYAHVNYEEINVSYSFWWLQKNSYSHHTHCVHFGQLFWKQFKCVEAYRKVVNDSSTWCCCKKLCDVIFCIFCGVLEDSKCPQWIKNTSDAINVKLCTEKIIALRISNWKKERQENSIFILPKRKVCLNQAGYFT